MIKSKRSEMVSLRITNKMRCSLEDIAIENEASISEVMRYAFQTLITK